MIHKVVLDDDRSAVLKRKLGVGDILILTDSTSERIFTIGIKPTECKDCPLGIICLDGSVKCRMLFYHKQKDSFNGHLPCNAYLLDGYDNLKPEASSHPIAYKQIDSLLEDL